MLMKVVRVNNSAASRDSQSPFWSQNEAVSGFGASFLGDLMGGIAPICPFCRKELSIGGVKDHIKAKHPNKYKEWINLGQPPYWRYHKDGEIKDIVGGDVG